MRPCALAPARLRFVVDAKDRTTMARPAGSWLLFNRSRTPCKTRGQRGHADKRHLVRQAAGASHGQARHSPELFRGATAIAAQNGHSSVSLPIRAGAGPVDVPLALCPPGFVLAGGLR